MSGNKMFSMIKPSDASYGDEREGCETWRHEQVREEKADPDVPHLQEESEDDYCDECDDGFAASDIRDEVWGEENDYEEDDEYGSRYSEEYAGSYAQQEMGYDDDVINDAFEGDPDNYWNID